MVSGCINYIGALFGWPKTGLRRFGRDLVLAGFTYAAARVPAGTVDRG